MAATKENKAGRNELLLTAPTTKSLVAQFTKRDLILYALGIGCCSDGDGLDGKSKDDRELQYVYENHPKFEAFPTFLLALSFVAEQQSTTKLGFGIRPFPPEYMTNYLEDGSKCGILPKEFFKNQDDIEEAQGLPILHIHQSLVLHHEIRSQPYEGEKMIDPPTQIQLQSKIVSVKPRSIGTFVTSETKYYQDGNCIATAQMVALVLGLDPDIVVPWKAPTNDQQLGSDSRKVNTKDELKEKSELKYRIPKNAALLYRLSGDYNSIHVEDDNILGADASDSEQKSQRGPVLMGLCTLGYALRAVLHHLDDHQMNKSHGGDIRLVSIQCNFVKPVYVGDCLHVVIWDEQVCTSGDETMFNVCFRVCASSDGKQTNDNKQSDTVVEKGRAQLCLRKYQTKPNMVGIASRL